jgi:hemerythrin-like domain-containing protein
MDVIELNEAFAAQGLGTILHYFTRFPERLHHPAEDRYLFAPLCAKTAEVAEVLDLLEKEHS